MVKKVLFTAMAVCGLAAVSVSATEPETAKFSYRCYEDTVYVTLNETLYKDEIAANAFFAVYDSGRFIAAGTEELEGSETNVDYFIRRIDLPYSPDRVSVKAFLWTADGKCTPLCDASELVNEYPIEDVSEATGVVAGMRPSTASELPMVSLMDENGGVYEYPVNDTAEADEFYSVLTGSDAQPYNGEIVTKDDIDVLNIDKNIVKYSIINGALVMNEKAETVGGEFAYDADAMSFGEYRIYDGTRILDIDMYIGQGSDCAALIEPSSLADGALYTVYLCDFNYNTGEYEYALMSSNTGVRAETAAAVVKEQPESVTVDGKEYLYVPVAVNGSESEWVYCADTDAVFNEGDIIFYSVDNNKVMTEFYKAFDMSGMSRYGNLADTVMTAGRNGGCFSSVISKTVLPEPSDNMWFKTTAQTEVKAYFGPVYRKNSRELELITGAEYMEMDDGTYLATDLYGDDLIIFTIWNDTREYCYDYTYRSGEGMRVNAGYGGGVSNALYHTCETYDGKLLWSGDGSEDTAESSYVEPCFAFVRTVNGEPADVVMFFAE